MTPTVVSSPQDADIVERLRVQSTARLLGYSFILYSFVPLGWPGYCDFLRCKYLWMQRALIFNYCNYSRVVNILLTGKSQHDISI